MHDGLLRGPHSGGSDFKGRVALVTGGGGGIGRAVALEFAREGARVVVADIDLELATKTCELSGAGESAVPFRCDVSSAEEVQRLVDFAVSKFGAIHHCFNNAGIEGTRKPLHETSAADFSRVMAVNAGGIFNCMAAELRQMLTQHAPEELRGPDDSPYTPKAIDRAALTIVNAGSTAGQAAMPEFSPYCASKHAVIGLTRCAAKEYAPKGIRVNCICPSTTATPMVERFQEQWPDWQDKQNASFPTQRIGTADEVARAVLWLSSSSCPMVCGACLNIDGALSS